MDSTVKQVYVSPEIDVIQLIANTGLCQQTSPPIGGNEGFGEGDI